MYDRRKSKNLKLVSNTDSAVAVAEPTESNRAKKVAIDVRGATVQYPVGPFVRGSLKSSLFSVFGHREATAETKYFEALQNLDLSVSTGERVGIIGSNGSGKTTLLRALSGAYPLKTGSITVVGQIGTLLDIGLGFEVESTGRENIYYRGMSMGYSPKEIAQVEQEIIAFADIGSFIDMPMRTYSAGMYVRLGFAVSTQFRPDVLLIDEIFGAGDAAFAVRAVARMMEIVESAGIVVLASHDLSLVGRLCNRVLWLDRGRIASDGAPSSVLPQFQAFMSGAS